MSLFYTKISLQGLGKLHRLKYKSWVYKHLKFGVMFKKLEIRLKNEYLRPKAGKAANTRSDIIKM